MKEGNLNRIIANMPRLQFILNFSMNVILMSHPRSEIIQLCHILEDIISYFCLYYVLAYDDEKWIFRRTVPSFLLRVFLNLSPNWRLATLLCFSLLY